MAAAPCAVPGNMLKMTTCLSAGRTTTKALLERADGGCFPPDGDAKLVEDHVEIGGGNVARAFRTRRDWCGRPHVRPIEYVQLAFMLQLPPVSDHDRSYERTHGAVDFLRTLSLAAPTVLTLRTLCVVRTYRTRR